MLLVGDVNDEMIKALEDASEQEKIIISSDGGNTYCANAIASFIRINKTEVTATGRCMSAALLILAAGAKRSATKGTIFMTHAATYEGRDATPGHLMADAKQAEVEEALWCDSMARLTKLTAARWAELSSTTTYFTTKEALEWGLIDEIIGDI